MKLSRKRIFHHLMSTKATKKSLCSYSPLLAKRVWHKRLGNGVHIGCVYLSICLCYCYRVVYKTIQNVSKALIDGFLATKNFNPLIWDLYFALCTDFLTQPCLQLEQYSTYRTRLYELQWVPLDRSFLLWHCVLIVFVWTQDLEVYCSCAIVTIAT